MAFTKPALRTSSSSNYKLLIFFLVFIFCSPIFLLTKIFPLPQLVDVMHLQAQPLTSFPPPAKVEPPEWLKFIRETHNAHTQRLRVGLVKFKNADRFHQTLNGMVDTVTINFDYISPNVTWQKLFPEWIDEGNPQCPQMPMPKSGRYLGLDVVVAEVPCKEEIEDISNGTRTYKEGIRDVRRLQLSLAVSRLIVENSKDKDVYAVFMSKCEPMVEIFRCDDLLLHEGDYWVYKPNVDKLREAISLPVGSCDLAHPYAGAPGGRQLQSRPSQFNELQATGPSTTKPRHAYVTVLHSTEDYVCGAIALAQSIRQTGSSQDLVLLADRTISNHSAAGLEAAGWKVKRIERIRSPNAKKDAYNEWNYSKLRVWQLTEYDKIMFIDSDFIVLRNIDHFFHYPQLSAAPNNNWLFNSGIMILEPSECFFDNLMSKRYKLKSYNGGDQGYLNEVLTWWHRLTTKLNFMKFYGPPVKVVDRRVPEDRYTIHYLGMKPWTCYRDYDCNWDRKDHHRFASDEVSARWWLVYDSMPAELQPYCGLTQKLDTRIRNRRKKAEKANLADGHWKIKIKDPRQYN